MKVNSIAHSSGIRAGNRLQDMDMVQAGGEHPVRSHHSGTQPKFTAFLLPNRPTLPR